MALSDAIKPIVSDEATTASDADASTAVRAVLVDLDAARAAGDEHAAFLMAFLDARVRHIGVPALFDTALDPVDTSVDLATAQLLQWVVVRGVVAVIVDAASAAEQPSGLQAPVAFARRQAAARPCSEFWGSEQGTTVANTVVSKVLGGVEIPGLKMPGIVELIVDLNSAVIPKSAFERVTRSIAKVNAATSLASLMMQLMSIEVGGAFDTLERTKTTTDGKRITNRLDLSIDPGKLPDQNKQVLCALSTMLNAAGISFSLPAAGPLVGVEVLLSGGTSFGDRVLFADQGHVKQDTDGTGSITFDLLGRAQRKDLPDDVPQIDLEYGVVVEATGDPVNGNSIFNTFFDSLTALPAGALGFVAPAIDIARTVHWDLGEQFAPLIDWQSEFPYQMVGSQGDEQFDQLVCDITEPFTLQGSVFTMNFTPSGNGGAVDATGSTGGARFEASGTYQLQMPDGLGRDGRLVANVTSTVYIPDREATVPLSIPFTLTALPPDAC